MNEEATVEKFFTCPKCASCTPHDERIKAIYCETCGTEMNESHVVKAMEGILDFKEGDKGKGVLQVHERGLSKEQTKLSGFFGWQPVEVSEVHLSRLGELLEADWKGLFEKAATGNSAPLASAIEKIDPETMDESDRRLLAFYDPISIHTDFRLQPQGAKYWEGGEGFTPGNQFQPNAFREIAEGKSDAKILGNFKVATGENEGKPPGVIRGALPWMEIGSSGPRIFPPGSPGGTSKAYTRISRVDAFDWTAGKQDEHFKEFMFDGKILKGRWIFQYAELPDGRREWLISRPEDQEMKGEAESGSEETEKALTLSIAKAEKRLITGIVLKPETTDSQGDIISEEAIEEAAHAFMEGYYEGTVKLGVQHKDYSRDLELVESYVALADMIVNGKNIKAGTWLMTIRVNDDQVWEAVKTGKLTGLSIKGKVRVISQG